MYNYYNYQPNDYLYNATPSIRNNKMELYSPKEGYDKGNMFTNLYQQYKDYKPKELKADNEKEALFLELSKNAFAAHDLRLYLDVNPSDKSMVQLFNDYNKKMVSLINEYENKYGSITTFDFNTDNFKWNDTKWPWEGGNI